MTSMTLKQRPLLLVVLLLFTTWNIVVEGYATYMTQSSYCSRSLTAGTQIMSHAAVSSTSRTITVTRNGVALNSGDAYVYGETLVASLSSTTGEYVMQVTGGAKVTGGGCTSTRVANQAATFTMPTSGSATISIVSGWTTAQNTPVGITPTITLVAPAAVAANPTPNPTIAPTLKPNITPYPTYTATNTPTAVPSTASIVVPTTDDGESGGNSQQAGLSSMSTKTKSWAGFGLAIAIGSVLIGGSYLLAMYRLSHPDDRHIADKYYTFTRMANFVALVFAFFAIIMMSMWTKKSNSDFHYLDAPSWENNLFAWHPVLMVCGFFVSQIGAIASWAILQDHYTAKLTHVFCQLAGLTTMISGLWAVWEYKVDLQSFNYTTIHSWLGIATVAVYVFTFFWGSFMAILTRFFPDSIFRKAFNLKDAHKNLGILALVMTTMSILTGVMDQLPQGSCNPNVPAYEQDAGQYYADIPGSCKVSYGMTMFVLLASIVSMFGIAYRGDSFGFTKPKAAAATPVPEKKAEPLEVPMVDNPQRSNRSSRASISTPTRQRASVAKMDPIVAQVSAPVAEEVDIEQQPTKASTKSARQRASVARTDPIVAEPEREEPSKVTSRPPPLAPSTSGRSGPPPPPPPPPRNAPPPPPRYGLGVDDAI